MGADRYVVHRALSTGQCGLAVVLSITALAAQGAEWTWSPAAAVEARQSTNPNLGVAVEDAVWTMLAEPRLNLQGRTETATLAVNTWLRASRWRYPHQETQELLDSFMNATVTAAGERDVLTLFTQYSHDSTVFSEIDDTGVVQANRRRDAYQVRPAWDYRLSERWALNLSYGYQDVAYEHGPEVGLYDYTNHSGTAALRNHFSEQDFWQVFLSVAFNDTPELRREFSNLGAGIGFSRQFSPTLSGQASAGARRTRSTQEFAIPGLGDFEVNESDSGGTLEVSVTQEGERSTFSGGVSRGFEPSGSGSAVIRDRLFVAYTHRFTMAFDARLTAEATQSDAVDPSVEDRLFGYLEPRVGWHWGQGFDASFGYRYRYQRYQDRDTDAEDHSLDVRFSYTWARRMAW